MREHVKAKEAFTREDVDGRGGARALPRRGPALQGRADRGPRPRRRRRVGLALHERPVHRPLPRPARARRPAGSRRSSCSRSPARTGAATPRARCSRGSTAPRSTRRRTSTSTSSGSSRRARATTASSAASSTCSCSPSSRPACPFWQPDGMVDLNALDELWRSENAARGYREVKTPILYDAELWKQSRATGTTTARTCTSRRSRSGPMGLKPMNCPAHIQIYKDARRSYRDLPIRYSEVGPRPPPRAERDAARPAARPPHHAGRRPHLLHRGADRGRGRSAAWTSATSIYDTFGFEPRLELSTRPEKRIGTDEMWDRAEAALDGALLDQRGVEYELNAGDGAFYGPEDRPPHDRLDRPLVAARHGPARLRRCPSASTSLHRRRQRRAPPGDDPPRAAAARSSASWAS